ncbi:DUF1295-domain-containing protein [Panus rudis PR-1116 ss-1]|nr:DUF1295-domain-containing protein [Panus rudis PR-1116 ss-1]
MPVLSKLLPVAAVAFGFQAACAAIFVPKADEKYYDLCGSLGFLTTNLASIYYPTLKARLWDKSIVPLPPWPSPSTLSGRQLVLNMMLTAWTVRLGTFLYSRAMRHGGDSRFDEAKHDPVKFTSFWLVQATWVFAVGLPVYLVNTIPSAVDPRLRTRDYLSIALMLGSWMFEIVADNQKAQWRHEKNNKHHDEKFITRGLWGISRHPNYVGEVGIWTGIWALSVPALITPLFPRYTWIAAGVSPLLTWFALRNVSGVPLLEEANDKKFGGDPGYEKYKKTVPVFWPWSQPSA